MRHNRYLLLSGRGGIGGRFERWKQSLDARIWREVRAVLNLRNREREKERDLVRVSRCCSPLPPPPPPNSNCFARPAGTRIESRVTSAATSLCKESVSWAILSHTSLAVASLSGRPSGGRRREAEGEGGWRTGGGLRPTGQPCHTRG